MIGSHCHAAGAQLSPQQLRRVVLDEHLRLEIEPRVHAQRFVRRPGIAIGAAVLAAAIGIDAVAERNVRAVVLANQCRRRDRAENGRHATLGGQ